MKSPCQLVDFPILAEQEMKVKESQKLDKY